MAAVDLLNPAYLLVGTGASLAIVAQGVRSFVGRLRARWTKEGEAAFAHAKALEANTEGLAAVDATMQNIVGQFGDLRLTLAHYGWRIGRLEEHAKLPRPDPSDLPQEPL